MQPSATALPLLFEIALTSTFLVIPFCTIGTTSIPFKGVVAGGNAVIVVFAMPNPKR